MNETYNIKARNLTKIVKVKGQKKEILHNVNFDIQKGEMIAVVGVSGAGKTTLINLLSGYSKVSFGHIYYDEICFNENPSHFKGELGYVPQHEILFEDITLYDTLKYTLELMDSKMNHKIRHKKIMEVLRLLEIDYATTTMIRNLSGGEKKRASIAQELLKNPKILYLDEPTSGLDSNIEKKFMHKLRDIANLGKTVFLTAHTVSNLYLCDKIIFMGSGGKICFIGSYEESLKFFKVKEFVDIYDALKENTDEWYQKFHKKLKLTSINSTLNKDKPKNNTGFLSQLWTLLKRNLKLKCHNKLTIFLLFFQAIIMSIAIFIAVERNAFQTYETAKIVLFGFTCAGIWLGMFNSVQEISREFSISKKEYMSNLNFASYIVSKVLVLAIICFIQMFLLIGIDYLLIDFPDGGIFFANPFFEYIIEYFLISFSAGCMGVFISSIVDKTETTMVILPIYVMFQLLFTGVLIPLNNFAEKISYFMTARWGVSGFGIIANLEKIALNTPDFSRALLNVSDAQKLFPHDVTNLLNSWAILGGVSIGFLILSIIFIHVRLRKDS